MQYAQKRVITQIETDEESSCEIESNDMPIERNNILINRSERNCKGSSEVNLLIRLNTSTRTRDTNVKIKL